MEGNIRCWIEKHECLNSKKELERLAIKYINGGKEDNDWVVKVIKDSSIFKNPQPIESTEYAKKLWLELYPEVFPFGEAHILMNTAQREVDPTPDLIWIKIYEKERLYLFQYTFPHFVIEVCEDGSYDVVVVVDMNSGKLITAFDCLQF